MSPVWSDCRKFLKTTAGALAASLAPHWFFGSPRARAETYRAKNDRPIIGAIGVGGRGTHIAGQARAFGDLVAVCDVDRRHGEAAKARFGGTADIYDDYRRLLDRSDIEAVTIGVPDHWHTTAAITALKAGKDVYCEKPLTLTIREGQQIIKVLGQAGRVFQVGTQQRSDWKFRLACEMVRNGRIGKVRKVIVTLPESTLEGGPFATKQVPEGLDWDFWLGQAPKVDYTPERCHSTFRWWYEYSGGVMTDWGAHHMDICHWGLGVEHSGPRTIDGKAKLPHIKNGYNTPKFFTVDMQYPDDVHVLVNIGDDGILFEGDRGRIYVNRGRIAGKPLEELAAELGKASIDELRDVELPGAKIKLARSDNHMGNFFDCIKSRQQPVSDVTTHHRTVSACHLANISMRLGRKLKWDAGKEDFIGDQEARQMISRPQRESYTVPA